MAEGHEGVGHEALGVGCPPPNKIFKIFWRQNRRSLCVLSRILVVLPARGTESTPGGQKIQQRGAAKVAERDVPKAPSTRA